MHPPPTPGTPPADTPARRLQVLVADDNAINQRIGVRLLRELGHGGVVVGDGQQVLRALGQRPFDLVLLDVSMPELDGVQALVAWRQSEAQQRRRRTPVVMVTGHDMPGDRERFLGFGADGHIVKPLTRDALLAVMRDLKLA